MELTIQELKKEDAKQAIQFAITGMHFDWYLDSRFLLNLYGRYFWYLEMTRATQVIAIYAGRTLAGVLLAEIHGEPKVYRSFWKSLYVKIFYVLQSLFAKGGADVYEEANREMLSQYRNRSSPDGEIIFLAANPDINEKGIGSALLREFEQREKRKQVYLFTDNACTYQFYEHRGFERVEEKEVRLQLGNKKIDLQCFLYHKTIP